MSDIIQKPKKNIELMQSKTQKNALLTNWKSSDFITNWHSRFPFPCQYGKYIDDEGGERIALTSMFPKN